MEDSSGNVTFLITKGSYLFWLNYNIFFVVLMTHLIASDCML